MVSISSWVTHTLPDGYRGQSPRDGAEAGLVVEIQWEGQAVLKKKKQQHGERTVLQQHHHEQGPPTPPCQGVGGHVKRTGNTAHASLSTEHR